MGDVVHGGAIASLLDTASMAAAWSDDTVPEATARHLSMNVDYVSAARGVDLMATRSLSAAASLASARSRSPTRREPYRQGLAGRSYG